MKNVVECPREFLAYFNALETYSVLYAVKAQQFLSYCVWVVVFSLEFLRLWSYKYKIHNKKIIANYKKYKYQKEKLCE